MLRSTSPEMGIRAGDRLYRGGWDIPLRAGMSRTTAETARAPRSGALAASARIDYALSRRRWRSYGAVLARLLHLSGITEVILEYVLGFGFRWTVFQALFMRDIAGGSYPRSLKMTFAPELESANGKRSLYR